MEDFVCLNCEEGVIGDGYTNHCPKCLWSRHVDINPGDRMEECKGMMKPAEVIQHRGAQVIVHKCITCGHSEQSREDRQF
jgi:hypothetical protein